VTFQLPALDPDAQVRGVYETLLGTWTDIQGHLEWMHDRIIELGATTVVELGSRSGVSTHALLAGVIETDGHLWAVDIAPGPRITHDRFTFVQGDDTSNRVIRALPRQIDVCFIDTSHHYRHTLAELQLWGSISTEVWLHDTTLEWPHEAPEADGPYPVRRAATDWSRLTNRPYEERSGSYGLGVIGPKAL